MIGILVLNVLLIQKTFSNIKQFKKIVFAWLVKMLNASLTNIMCVISLYVFDSLIRCHLYNYLADISFLRKSMCRLL